MGIKGDVLIFLLDLSSPLHLQVMRLAEDQISNGVQNLGLVTPAGTNVNERAYHIVQLICVAVQLLTWAVNDERGKSKISLSLSPSLLLV